MNRLTDASLENPRVEFEETTNYTYSGTRYDLKLSYIEENDDEVIETECCCDFFIANRPIVSTANSATIDNDTYIDFGHGKVPCEMKTKITKKTREMTLSEIEKELGYPVKIVME